MFSTLIGMIETDTHAAWAHFHCATNDSETKMHAEFTEALAKQLLTNTLDESAAAGRRSSTNTSAGKDKSVGTSDGGGHTLVSLKEHPHYAPKGAGAKARCHICGEQCYHYCKECTAIFPRLGKQAAAPVWAVCGLRSKRGMQCIKAHQQEGAAYARGAKWLSGAPQAAARHAGTPAAARSTPSNLWC